MDNENINIELQQAWNKMSKQKFENKHLEKKEIMNAIKAKSKFTIVELKKGLKTKINFAVLFIGVFLWFAINDRADQMAFWFYIIMSIVYALGSIFLYNRYRKMDDKLKTSKSLLKNLKANKLAISSALFIERIWGLLAIVFFIAFYFYRWAQEATEVNHIVTKISIFLVIILIIGFLAEKGNEIKFGKKIKEIEENIIRLEMLS